MRCNRLWLTVSALAAKRTLLFNFGGGLKTIFCLGNGVLLLDLNLGDRRGKSDDDDDVCCCCWNLGERRGEIIGPSSVPFRFSDFVWAIELNERRVKAIKDVREPKVKLSQFCSRKLDWWRDSTVWFITSFDRSKSTWRKIDIQAFSIVRARLQADLSPVRDSFD